LNQTPFASAHDVEKVIQRDLAEKINSTFLSVKLFPLHQARDTSLIARLEGIYLDDLEVDCSDYHENPNLLTIENTWVKETVFTDLLKSNCLVTNQPDWCSVQIAYQGKKINHEGLLRYIVSFRNDNEFHEQCIEKIFMRLMTHCQPEQLTVYGRSTRRGGIDINSYRSTHPFQSNSSDINFRLFRQ
jgi:7-cyano-7-deazaguanine reductase